MKPIPGFEGLYSAEEDGRIYSHKRNIYLKPALNNKGYYKVNIHKDRIQNFLYVHRLVALTFIPNPDNKKEIDHIDRDSKNNSINNLKWATRSENNENRGIQRNNKLKEHYILYNECRDDFKFQITRNGINHQRYFKTLEEAKEYRDTYLSVPN